MQKNKFQNLASKDYWDTSYKNIMFSAAGSDNPVRKFIEAHIQKGAGSCFEIGCFPGQYLTVFGDLGYSLNGIDLHERTTTELFKWLQSQKYSVGEFTVGDFIDYCPQKKYNIVCSFGFIEHFTEWEEIVTKHGHMTAEDGFIVITTPNFRGLIQRMFHFLVDRQNYRRHVISAMNPKAWEHLLSVQGFEIVFSGYFGEIEFWVDTQERNFIQKKIIQWLQTSTPFLRKLLPKNRALYAPYCGIIARRLSFSVSK